MTATAVAAKNRGALGLWLVPTGLFALIAIGILWALPRSSGVCPAISPGPCSTTSDPGVVIVFLVLVVFVYAALIACALLLERHRGLVLGLLSGALGLVFLVGVVTVLATTSTTYVVY